MVDFRIIKHSQWTTNPLNPPYQGDFGSFDRIGVIGKCLGRVDICKVIYNRRGEVPSSIDQYGLEIPNHIG